MANKWDKFYLDITERVGQMSHATRFKVGAVLVRDNNILAFGYNGTPSGMDNNCEYALLDSSKQTAVLDERGVPFMITKPEVLHAELNAYAKIAKSTQTSENSTLYLSLSPCIDCAKLILQAGTVRVVYKNDYRCKEGVELLKLMGVEVIKYTDMELTNEK